MSDSEDFVEPFIPPSPSFFERKVAPSIVPPRLPTPPPGTAYAPYPPTPSQPLYGYTPNTPWPYQIHPQSAMLPPHYPYPLPLSFHPTLSLDTVGRPGLAWDIVNPPTSSRACDTTDLYRRWKITNLDAEAFRPSVSKAWILSNHPSLFYWVGCWGPILVYNQGITIGDILQAIWKYLQQPLSARDLTHINSFPGSMAALNYAISQPAREAAAQGVGVRGLDIPRRVDVLGGHRRFNGLSIVPNPDNTWVLLLSLAPGPVPRVILL